jgi:hypothetical protein
MKKNASLLFIIASTVLWSSCNNAGQPPGAEEKPDSIGGSESKINARSKPLGFINDCKVPGMHNFIISREEADKMIGRFQTVFMPDGKPEGLNTPVWIDSCIISSLGRFLNVSSTPYDGIRIYNCANRITHKSSVLLQLTTPDGPGKHKDVYDTFEVKCSSGTSFRNFNRGKNGDAIKKHFNKKFREASDEDDYNSAAKDSLSWAVWVDKCVITSIAKLLDSINLKLDGLYIYSGAYSEFQMNRDRTERLPISQKKANQSTFILVPSHTKNGTRSANWDVINALDKEIFTDQAYNHGELCPQNCN